MLTIMFLICMVVMVKLLVTLIAEQVSDNTAYATPFAMQAALYWVIRYPRGGANYTALCKIPVVGFLVKLFVGYVEGATKVALGAGGAVGMVGEIIGNAVFGSEGVAAFIHMFMVVAPTVLVTAVVGYLIIFPLSYLWVLKDVKAFVTG